MGGLNNPRSLVIVPTYNESNNVKLLFKAIHEVVPGASVLFVDDNSQDGTQKAIRELMNNNPSYVNLLARPGKMGLGTAYVDGFIWGLNKDFDYFFQIDADFSHNPKYLKKFQDLLKSYDVVIGSRYIPGGGVTNWSFLRKLISRFGSLYARAILGLKARDLTGGFNCWRRSVLEAIHLSTIESEGYSFQIELKYRAIKSGFNVIESPIIFEERRAGKSKMSMKIVVEAFYKVFLIKKFRPH